MVAHSRKSGSGLQLQFSGKAHDGVFSIFENQENESSTAERMEPQNNVLKIDFSQQISDFFTVI